MNFPSPGERSTMGRVRKTIHSGVDREREREIEVEREREREDSKKKEKEKKCMSQ